MKKSINSVFGAENVNFARKILLIMRLTVFLSLFATMQIMGMETYSQKTKISLIFEDAPLKEILRSIEKETDFRFMYSSAMIDVDRKIDVHIENVVISEVLDKILKDTEVQYKIKGEQILLSFKSDMIDFDFNVQQPISINGKVTDSGGQPLPGLTVLVKGTALGTITNANGEYSLINIPENAILVFSFVGMLTQEVVVGNQSTINVVMTEDAIRIEEFVAIGYGTVRKSDLTGSVASVKAEAFLDQPASSINSVLSGRAPGVTVRRSNGNPGMDPVIRIRGVNSLLGDNNPLIVVDGNYGNLPDMYDIESIEILKDASATAIYGSRGANGVILVKTKRGKQGKPTLEFYSDFSFDNIPRRYDLMDAYEFAEFNNSTGAYPFTAEELANFKANGGVDWQDEVLQTGISQTYKSIISGGTNNAKYYVTPSYSKSTGILRNTEASKYGLEAKLDLDLSDRVNVKIESSIGSSDVLNRGLGSGSDKTAHPLVAAVVWSPTEPVYNEDLTFKRLGLGSGSVLNPLLLTERNNTNFGSSARGIGNIQIKIIDGLILDAKGLISYGTGGSRFFDSKQFATIPSASQSYSERKSWLVNAFLTYSKTFVDVHNLSAMSGMEETKAESQGLDGETTQLPFESFVWYNLGSGAPNINVGSNYSNSALRSYFGRLNYDYDSRYYVTVNFRADGSSKFKGDNQFGYFPSFALAWRLSNEKFMKSQNLFQNIKIRGGWGITGNQAISSYATYKTMKRENYDWGTGVDQVGYRGSGGGNRNLKWESTTQINVGVDLATLANRLTFTIDYYEKITEDLLAPATTPAYNGGGGVTSNLGSVENKGFEMNVDYIMSRKTNDFSYNINLNGSINRNKVLDIGEQEMLGGSAYVSGIAGRNPFVMMPGKPIGTIYGLKYLGIWQENEAAEAAKFFQEPGDYKYEDLNGNYSYDKGDNQVIGNTNPSFVWGFNNHFSYKNFDLNILFEGVYDRDVLNWSYMAGTELVDFTQTYNFRIAKDRWTPENPNAEFAKIGNTNRLTPVSSQFLQSGDYVKLRNISLSYRIPKRVMPFTSIRLSASAQNILTITKYKGLDPEISSTSGNSQNYDRASGMDWFAYPNPKSISFGISLIY